MGASARAWARPTHSGHEWSEYVTDSAMPAVGDHTDAAAEAAPEDAGRAGANAVSLVGLHKQFGEIRAVDGIDLDIADGEFFSMLGPSGSGKTTVWRMIAGFELPTEGRVFLGGQDVTKQAPFERDVNTVFQDYALFP